MVAFGRLTICLFPFAFRDNCYGSCDFRGPIIALFDPKACPTCRATWCARIAGLNASVFLTRSWQEGDGRLEPGGVVAPRNFLHNFHSSF